MQTKVMTFLLPLPLIRAQSWCVCECAVYASVCVCVCVLHSLCLVASACLDQLSVWYPFGSNFSQCILVMVLLCTQAHTITVSNSTPPSLKMCVYPIAIFLERFEYVHQTFLMPPYFQCSPSALPGLFCAGRPEQQVDKVVVVEAVFVLCWFVTLSRGDDCLQQQYFINLFLAVSTISCPNMNGMIGTRLISSSKEQLSFSDPLVFLHRALFPCSLL